MNIYSDKLAYIVINCRYSVAQMCTREDTLTLYLGMLSIYDVMSHNELTTLYSNVWIRIPTFVF